MENKETEAAIESWHKARANGKPIMPYPNPISILELTKKSFSDIWSHGLISAAPEPRSPLSLRINKAYNYYRTLGTLEDADIRYHICEILIRLYWLYTGEEQPCSELKGKPTMKGIRNYLYNFQELMSKDEKVSFRDIISLIEKDERERKQKKESAKKVFGSKPKAKRTKRTVL